MNLPAYCGGRKRHKRSPPPGLSLLQNTADPASWLTRRLLKKSLYLAAKRKRIKVRIAKQAARLPIPKSPCFRRYFEFQGIDCPAPYIEEPRAIIARPKIAYTVLTGMVPLASFTDAREAELSCISLRADYPSAHFITLKLIP